MGRARIRSLIVAGLTLVGCGSPHGERREGTGGADEQGTAPFRLTAGRGDFLFEWADPTGEFKTATRLQDVPERCRAKVRVEPLSLPPERRAPPDRVYLADLRKAGRDGTYPVRVVPREEFEALAEVVSSPLPPLRPDAPTPPPSAPPAPGDGGTVAVIVYGASWCGACHQAAAWLRAHNVAFEEKDIERDPGARSEMAAKCRAAGIDPRSIPIIDVGGRVVQGFSAATLGRLLSRP